MMTVQVLLIKLSAKPFILFSDHWSDSTDWSDMHRVNGLLPLIKDNTRPEKMTNVEAQSFGGKSFLFYIERPC